MDDCLEHLITEDCVMGFGVNFPKQMELSKCWAGKVLTEPWALSSLNLAPTWARLHGQSFQISPPASF